LKIERPFRIGSPNLGRKNRREEELRLKTWQAGRRNRESARSGDGVFYGQQPGMVMLSDRKLQIQRPRFSLQDF
jgi:hypothetical protein